MVEDTPHPAHKSRLRNAAGHRLFPLAVAVLAMALVLPSLSAGFLVDDYHHKLLFSNSESPIRLLDSPLDLFVFFDGDPDRLQQLKDIGFLPWWTGDNIKAAFWRPVTSLTHWLDYTLWPDTPALMHAQSIVWYGLLALVAALLYRRIAPTASVAAIAGLLFAFDDAHGTPVGFLANRNALVAAVFGVLCLIAHDRYRRDKTRPAAIWAVALLAVTLLAAEAGIATIAYLASYALFIDPSPWKDRVRSLVPYIVIVIVWRLVWSGLGYGIANIGVYIDPLGEPTRYIAAVKDRGPILLLGQLLTPPADITMILEPADTRRLWLAAVVFLALFGVLLIALLREDRVARFWALGMVLSVLPICATFPSDRLLVFTGIGAMGLIAQFLTASFNDASRRLHQLPRRLGAVVLGSVFILFHAVLAPPLLIARSAHAMAPKAFTQQVMLGPLDPVAAQQDLIVVNPPLAFLTGASAAVWVDEGTPFPRHLRLLGSSLFMPVQVRRSDANTLIVRPHYGYYGWVLDALFRDPAQTFHPGQRVELAGMTVEVLEVTATGRPLEAAFIFPVSLEDPSLRWMQYGANGFEPFTPPAVGQTVILPGSEMPWNR